MVWIQLYGTIKYEWIKQNQWWFMYAISLPIAYFMTTGTHLAFTELKDSAWAVRFSSYALNMFIFAIMAYIINSEGISLKTSICLTLSVLILLIQFFWK